MHTHHHAPRPAAYPFGILHKKSHSQLQKFVNFANVKTLDKIEIL